MTIEPSIALLIPAFNAENTIGYLLADASAQTRSFDEIIVLNDGSTDQTESIVRQFDVKIINAMENRGVATARKALLENCVSDFVHFHDADDRMKPEFVERILPHCRLGAVTICAMEEISESGATRIQRHDRLPMAQDNIDYMIDHFVHLNASVFDRQLAIKAGFETSFSTNEDRLFNYAVAALKPEYKYLDEVLVLQQRTKGSLLSRTKTNRIVENFIRGADYARSILPEKNWPTLGRYCLHYAWQELLKANTELSAHAVEVANRCGVSSITNQGRKVEIASRVMGVWKTMRLRALWVRLRSKG